MTRVIVHIDRLILKGVSPADADGLSAGLRESLSQSLANSSYIAALQAQDRKARINIGKIQLGSTPKATGRSIAERITGSPQ